MNVDLMPKIVFEQRVLDRVRATRDRLVAEGGLLPKDTLARYLQRFREKYGPEVLQGLDGLAPGLRLGIVERVAVPGGEC